jgi:drug/metabolite transporter (DMT)-like permease
MNRVSPKVLALLGTLTLVWGTNWPLFKIALDELPVLTFRAIVLVTASVVLLAIMLARGERFAVPRGKWPALIAASVTNLFIWNIATSLAVLYIPSGHASVLAYTMPLWVALIGFAVFGQRLTGRPLAAILIGAGAVVALMVPNFASYAYAPAGLFWGLFAGFCWAVGTFIVKRTSWRGMGLSLTFWQVVITLPPIVLGRPVDRRPADALAVDTGAGRHDLHRRRSDGAGHRRLVRPGEAFARPGRGPLRHRHPDRGHRERRADPA